MNRIRSRLRSWCYLYMARVTERLTLGCTEYPINIRITCLWAWTHRIPTRKKYNIREFMEVVHKCLELVLPVHSSPAALSGFDSSSEFLRHLYRICLDHKGQPIVALVFSFVFVGIFVPAAISPCHQVKPKNNTTRLELLKMKPENSATIFLCYSFVMPFLFDLSG